MSDGSQNWERWLPEFRWLPDMVNGSLGLGHGIEGCDRPTQLTMLVLTMVTAFAFTCYLAVKQRIVVNLFRVGNKTRGWVSAFPIDYETGDTGCPCHSACHMKVTIPHATRARVAYSRKFYNPQLL